MRILTTFTLSIALLFQAGCSSDDGRPADMPPLFPVSVTITQGGNPLEGATVTLLSVTPATYGEASGITDASGTTRIFTYGYSGAPAGEYVVTVEKTGLEGAAQVTDPEGDVSFVGGQTFRYTDTLFAQRGTTTLKVTITNSAVSETFDIGEPVRVFVRDNTM